MTRRECPKWGPYQAAFCEGCGSGVKNAVNTSVRAHKKKKEKRRWRSRKFEHVSDIKKVVIPLWPSPTEHQKQHINS